MGQRKAAGGGVGGPHHCAKGARRRGHAGHRAADCRAKPAIGNGRRISVAHDRRCRQPLTAGQHDARCAALFNQDFAHRRAVAIVRAIGLADCLQRARQGVHAAVNQPHAARLDMRDQHQRGGAFKGR